MASDIVQYRDPNFISEHDADFQDQMATLKEANVHNMELMKESIAELELALEDEGWRRLGIEGEREFTRQGLDKIIALARIMFLKNPLIQRGVEIRAFYVWGQGVEIQADEPRANEIVQAFLNDQGNRREFTSHASRVMKEKKLESEGNLFFVLFRAPLGGPVSLRSLPVQEVRDVVTNPDDRNEIWYYQREWVEERKDLGTGQSKYNTRFAYYPDWTFDPKKKPNKIGKFDVRWDSPVYHVKVGGFDDMRFGVPETYAAIDWARAYKGFLEDWASLVKAISRFAWKVTQKRKSLIGETKKKLESTRTIESAETNPPPTAASTFVGSDDVDLVPINKSGATTSAADGKQLRLMVASALHLPDTILSNDPQQGALATAKTLDRPTEMAILDRQTLWKDILEDILSFVISQAASTSAGGISVEFPPVVEYDLKDRIEALISAMTLDGKTDAGIAPRTLWRRLILTSLGVKNIEDIIADMEKLDEEAGEVVEEEEESLRIGNGDLTALVEELKELKKELV